MSVTVTAVDQGAYVATTSLGPVSINDENGTWFIRAFFADAAVSEPLREVTYGRGLAGAIRQVESIVQQHVTRRAHTGKYNDVILTPVGDRDRSGFTAVTPAGTAVLTDVTRDGEPEKWEIELSFSYTPVITYVDGTLDQAVVVLADRAAQYVAKHPDLDEDRFLDPAWRDKHNERPWGPDGPRFVYGGTRYED